MQEKLSGGSSLKWKEAEARDIALLILSFQLCQVSSKHDTVLVCYFFVHPCIDTRKALCNRFEPENETPSFNNQPSENWHISQQRWCGLLEAKES